MKSFALLFAYFIFAFADVQEPSSYLPRNVTVETLHLTLRIRWQAPSIFPNTPMFGYRIKYMPSDWNPKYAPFHYETSDCSEEKCSHDLTYLEENTEYTIGISGTYSLGQGPTNAWQMTLGTTAIRTPFLPPQDFRCEAIDSTKIRVWWDNPPMESIHGVFKGFRVAYAPDNVFYDEDTKYDRTESNALILNGLEANTLHGMTVSAANSAGDGVASGIIYCLTKEDVPDEPTSVKVIVQGPEKVMLLWHAPLSDQSGRIVHYTIYYQKSGDEAKTRQVLESEKRIEISGLESNVSYEFWITASTKAGEGPASDYFTAIPSNETQPKISTYSKGKFTAKFKESVILPCNAIGSPTPKVTWEVVQNERFQILDDGSLFIDDIVREDANNYTCVAINSFGNDSITHELIVQAPPTSPLVTVLSTTSNEITFQVNSTYSLSNYEFALYYKLDSEIEDFEKVEVLDSQPYTIKNCACGSPYKIYAYESNEFGDGDSSEIITVRTNGSKPITPAESDFLEPSVGAVKLKLLSWSADICPITHFFVAYKEKKNTRWVKIHQKLQPNTDFVLHLEPAISYEIRVTAHNAAGSSKADYELETLTGDTGTSAPPSNITEVIDVEVKTI